MPDLSGIQKMMEQTEPIRKLVADADQIRRFVDDTTHVRQFMDETAQIRKLTQIESFQPPLTTLVPQRNPLVVEAEANYASEFHKRLAKSISDFDATLDQAHEVGVRLVSFGQTVVFHLDSMGYWNPSLITFSGHTDDGNPVELIQHVSQISVLLMKLPRQDPTAPKRPIGFSSEAESDSEVESGD